MKKISEQLASLYFTTIILIVLMLWFTWGILLAQSNTFGHGFDVMNSTLAPAWFSRTQGLSLLLKLWFVGLCVVMAVLAINLVFCSWVTILKIIRIKLITHKLIMLIIHLVFGMVALGHFGSFFLGYRYENVKLHQGQSFALKDGHILIIKDVHFVDNPQVLGKSPKELSPEKYHHNANFSEVTLSRNGKPVTSGRIYFLRPLTYKDIQVTLKRFTPPKGINKNNHSFRKPGVKLVISKNPVKALVFALFPAMIFGIGVYTIMTWGNRKGKARDER
ncbi:MAG: hypothetical protein SRB2_00473 [Desulfobacteraceae bacterium Eth-SRB2]|nr:MAG: hypothetical protein SRB2_00473 [Desulfobacteraceae bacterium Eth-SRB2]